MPGRSLPKAESWRLPYAAAVQGEGLEATIDGARGQGREAGDESESNLQADPVEIRLCPLRCRPRRAFSPSSHLQTDGSSRSLAITPAAAVPPFLGSL